MRRLLSVLGAGLMLAGSPLIAPRQAQAANAEVFSGWIISTDRLRHKMRIRTPGGRRVVWLQVQNVWRGESLIGRKVLEPGMRVLVTAQRTKKDWRASRVQIM